MDDGPVVNASPLIYLSRAGHLDLLQIAGKSIFVPESVILAIGAKGTGDATVLAVASASWLTRVPRPAIPARVAAWDLGAGEASVIAWAIGHPGATAILDDLQARRCAATLGVPCIGILGVVLAAKRKGRISAARPVVEELVAHGMYLSDGVIARALSLVGE